MGRVDYPCVSGALRDVYNGVETPPFKPYLYAHVREEKPDLGLHYSRTQYDIYTRTCAGRNAVLPISIVSTRDIHTRTSRGGEVAVVL